MTHCADHIYTKTSIENKKEHRILYSNKDRLKNEYGLILINYNRCKNIDRANVIDLYDWLISESARSLITDYKIDGNQVFYID